MTSRHFIHVHQLLSNRRFQVAILWGVAILVYCLSPLRSLWNRETLVLFLNSLGVWGPVLFMGLYAGSMVIGFPTVIFTIAGGAVFGLLWGTLYSVLGASLGAVGAFYLSRYLLRQWVEQRYGHNLTLTKFQHGIANRALFFVMAVRFNPVTPFNIENYLFGLTLIHWRPYLFGTVVGIIPGTIAYTWVGVTGAKALEGESALSFILAVSVLLVISVSPLLVSYWRDRQSLRNP